MKIGIIGVGNLGYSVAIGILSEKQHIKCKSLYLSKRNPKSLENISNLSVVKIISL